MSLEVLVSVLQQCFVCCLVLSDDSRLALYPLWFSFYSSTRVPFVSSCHLLIRVSLISFVVFISFLCPLVSCHAITRQEIGKEIKRFFLSPQHSMPFLKITMPQVDMVHQHKAVITQVRIVTDKRHYPAVFNNGLCLTVVNTE